MRFYGPMGFARRCVLYSAEFLSLPPSRRFSSTARETQIVSVRTYSAYVYSIQTDARACGRTYVRKCVYAVV